MPTPAPALSPSHSTPSTGPRVLVVDDDRAIRELFRTVLRRANFIVEVAESGAAALRRLQESAPDLVTLDLAMPDMDGFAVIDRLRALPSSPPIVVVSGKDHSREMLCLSRPVVECLPKPLHPGDLVAACKRALHVDE